MIPSHARGRFSRTFRAIPSAAAVAYLLATACSEPATGIDDSVASLVRTDVLRSVVP
ncbi:MAG: hypothetical protein U0169_13450 [Polyangiaceae bacterium]